MYSFGSAGGLGNRRSFKKSSPLSCASSLGVRKGYLADVEHPLPEGAQAKRTAKRVPTTLRIRVGNDWQRVSGDVSAGGALILTAQQLEARQLDVAIQLAEGGQFWQVTAEVIRCGRRGQRFAHHVRFNNPDQTQGLAAAIQRCVSTGATRLETV